MTAKAVVVGLMGGLGNQMFQYAAGRAIAQRHSRPLIIDAATGFWRDNIYKRRYELDPFAIRARKASLAERLPFWLERAARRIGRESPPGMARRPWGSFLTDDSGRVVPQAFDSYDETLYLRGYWQSEAYFTDIRAAIGSELRPPPATAAIFVEAARRVEACNSVAIGVRLFEEVPGGDKGGVGGLVDIACYNRAARLLCERIEGAEFFVFCTSRAAALGDLDLPGRVHFVTHDNGYHGTIERLWLLSRCRHHVVSNSTFYWWGAWLAEVERPETRVVAIDKFTNPSTIPARWTKLAPDAS